MQCFKNTASHLLLLQFRSWWKLLVVNERKMKGDEGDEGDEKVWMLKKWLSLHIIFTLYIYKYVINYHI